MKIKFGDIEFSTKKEVEKYIRNLFLKHGFGFKIYPNDNYFNFFFDLLKNHPEYEQKIIYGISYFHFGSNPLHNFIELQVVGNGGYCAFGWKTALSGKVNKQPKIYEAMRVAIVPQIDAFFIENGKPEICPICQMKKDYYHVDHIIKFKELADEFISKYGTLEKFGKNKFFQNCFLDDNYLYKQAWIDFHFEKAKLRIICAECNLKLK